MIKCKISLLVVAMLLFVPCLALALPAPHDPSSGYSYTCESCHVSPKSYGNTDANFANNVCLTCHKPSDTNTKKAFTPEDFADINNASSSVRTIATTAVKTSHKWSGPEVNATAKALKPVDTTRYGLNAWGKGFNTSLACVRCHSIHGWVVNQRTAPFLRVPNDTDQMCMNCHRQRANTTATAGSHPVSISYTSASIKAKAGSQFYLVNNEPRKNPINSSAEMKNKKSKVVCSSCHGVHVSDSNSATFDSYSSSNFGKLSSSDGSLLRVSKRGADNKVDTVNICTNCHITKHTGQVQQHTKSADIQCMDCHNAHVDTIAASDAVQNPNIKLLRRYVNYSGVKGDVRKLDTYRKRLVYTGTDNAGKWSAANGTGVCQACHALPATVTQHSDYALVKSNCISCHADAPHTDTTPTGCTGCHGSPPQNNLTAADSNGRNAGYTNYDETTTPHLAHTSKAVACSDCHGAKSPNHLLATPIADDLYPYYYVFKPAPWSAGTKAGSNATYTHNIGPTASTCNLVYCHSDGTTANPLAANFINGMDAVKWNSGTGEGTAGSIIGTVNECITCHDNKTTTFKGSHQKHRTTGYKCATCHGLTVASGDSPVTSNINHVNTVKEVQFSNRSAASGSYTSAGKTCAVACHSDGRGAASITTPVWGTQATGACGTCHKTAAIGSLASGSHPTHFSGTVLGATDTICTSCHAHNGSGATHVNGAITANYTGGGSCATNNCHANMTPPTWGVNTTNTTCTKCHGTGTVGTIDGTNRDMVAPVGGTLSGTGQVSNNAKVGAHKTHLRYLNGFSNYSTVDYRCESCHGTLPSVGTHANGSSTPNFQSLATKWGARTADFTAGSCNNTYCHNPAGTGGTMDAANAGSNTVPSWTGAAYIADGGKSLTNCQLCHKVPGSDGFSKASAHGSMMTDASANQCNTCHGHNGDATGVTGRRHIDGILYVNGTCDSCHGYPPMTQVDLDARSGGYVNAKLETAGGGGHHKTHLLPTIIASDGFAPCLPCHPSDTLGFHMQGGGTVQTANVNVFYAADTDYRFDDSRAKRYISGGKTCSNVSCHFQPTPAW